MSARVPRSCLLLSLVALGACGSDDTSSSTPTGSATGTSTGAPAFALEQSGVTWGFDSEPVHGQFVNGDYWVVGPVTLASISPAADVSAPIEEPGICDGFSAGDDACAAHCAANAPTDHVSLCTDDDLCLCGRGLDGWEVNPVVSGGQGFDHRAGAFDGRLVPSLPYVAEPGQSIIKVVSTDHTVADCLPCVSFAAVLTVLDAPPPDGGATVFRPPYVGANKPLYSTASLRTDLLPSLAAVDETPTLESMVERFGPLQLDHKVGFPCRRLHPEDTMPNYGCDVGSNIGDGVLRTMLDEPVADKLPALARVLQYGIDQYHAALLGRDFSVGCDGHMTGYKVLLTFTATLFDDDAMRAVAGDRAIYEEDLGVYASTAAGLELYGYDNADELHYWARIAAASGYRANRDPYELIDGGEGLSNYQGIVSPTWKGEALAVHLMPELAETWNAPEFLRYVDRWVNFGFWTQPDPCAPADGLCSGGDNPGAACTFASAPTVCTGTDAVCDGSVYWDPDGSLGLENHYGVTYGPDGSGGCILDTDASDGTGRFPQNHQADADGPNRRSVFQGFLWDAYRGPSCFDGACESGESAEGCPFDCG